MQTKSWNISKSATAEKKTMYETQITLHLSWCNKLVVMLGFKVAVKREVKFEVKLCVK